MRDSPQKGKEEGEGRAQARACSSVPRSFSVTIRSCSSEVVEAAGRGGESPRPRPRLARDRLSSLGRVRPGEERVGEATEGTLGGRGRTRGIGGWGGRQE